MCQEYTITYKCHADCTYSHKAWSTYCERLQKDNQQGRCGQVTDGGTRRIKDVCRIHRGMEVSWIAAADVEQPAREGTWQNYHNTSSSATSDDRFANNAGHKRLRKKWAKNEHLYERELNGMPSNPRSVSEMTRADWACHNNRQLSATSPSGDEYWVDPEPWGDERQGGRIEDEKRVSEGKKSSRAVFETVRSRLC